MRKISGIFVCAALALAGAQAAQAQDYPTRPVRVVVAFPPGGPTDFVGRLMTDKMSAALGQRVYIENKPGAAGTVGADNIAKADPDGYSLFLTTSGAVTIAPHIQQRALRSAARFRSGGAGHQGHRDTGGHAEARHQDGQGADRARQGKARRRLIRSTGIGSPPHLALELLDVSANVKFLHVPYRGAAPALTDLLGGQVQVLAADLPVLISQIQAGTLVPIGAASDKRDALLPDVPTLAEQGYPNTDASNWYALLAPAKTPPALIAKLNKAVIDALSDPEVHEKLVKAGATPVGGTPEALGAFMKAEYEKWGKVVKERGIKDTP